VVPDPIVPDVQAAAPSAAVVSAFDPSADPLESLSATELQTWRTTGAMPDAKPSTPPADSSPAPAVQDPPASTDASPEAASEPADPVSAKTKTRIDELLADRARERDRAERAEQRARDLEARHRQPPPDARPAAPSPAPAGLVKPDPETFAYGTADPAYLEALTDYKVALADQTRRAEWTEGQRQERAREESARVIKAFESRAAEARSKHADFDAVALLAPTEIPQGSAADLWVLEDEAGAEILYHLQQPANAGERRRILSLSPREQLKELVRLGDRLSGAAPAARSTNAPPPPPTVPTRATPADPVERALAMGDSDAATAAYIKAQNARDLAARKR
jgi:hypothetical protein